MRVCKRALFCAAALLLGCAGVFAADAPGWKFNLAQAKITPQKLFWMAGFGARTKPAEGTLDDLWVRALALEAPDGRRGVIFTLDLVGIPKNIYDKLCDEIHRRHGLERSQIMFCNSHTHSGPVLREALQDIYPLDQRQRDLIEEYSQWLEKAIVDAVGQSLASWTPGTLHAGEGTATIAMNRRTNRESDLPEMIRRGIAPKGPSDFSVPVLAVRSADGKLRAVLFGYAAHTSTLYGNQWSADYAGVTRKALEDEHPGTTALFFQGCGSDQSAVPRGTVEKCRKLGEALAASVERVLAGPMRPVAPQLRTALEFVSLDFGQQPTKAELEAAMKVNVYRARWAKRLLGQLESGQPFAKGYPEYPVQVWRLGADQLWITLGGEVCVDYALKFKRLYGPTTWVAGYTNDVMAYIPSRRVWEEGGYQAGAFEVYGLPALRWCPDIEERISAAAARLVDRVSSDAK